MITTLPAFEGPVCPVPLNHLDQIVMGHGSGGRMTTDLIRTIFQPHFSNPALNEGNDFASLPVPAFENNSGQLILSIDSHVVKPIFFPGGDIGRLSICGTVNDIAVSGAKPLYITAGFILEEGFQIENLEKIIQSMEEAANEAGVQIVAGDTKVVEKGGCDQVFITTTGVGWLNSGVRIGGQYARPGDVVIVSGPVGDHGIAILAARGELGLDTEVKSDTAPLNNLIDAILEAAPHTHVLRDPTRGGLATTLNEIAGQSKVSILLEEDSIPINPNTRSACEILGFDPLYIANEGKVIVITPEKEAEAALTAMRQNMYGKDAAIIGRVIISNPGKVMVKTSIGGTRLLDMLAGEMLPRIC
ncbi:hydrogenase expression/formation protein HypE [Leptolinea sp. HRD-7]|nr:hydrogenase expression/formation protein HypE [Leptolinea sp. HRD-7]